MRRPRRIFRGSALVAARSGSRSPAVSFRPTVMAVLVAMATGCGVILLGHPTDLFGRAPTASGLITASAPAVAVVDGQTLRLHETVVQLEGVRAPPRGAECRAADGVSYDCGNAAAEALGHLLVGLDVACRVDGRSGHGPPEARCEAGGTNVNRAIIAAGWARAGTGNADLAEAERGARGAQRGVWRDLSGPSF